MHRMRETHRCPKCEHPEVLYLPQLSDTQRDKLAAHVDAPGWTTIEHYGVFEAYLCRACGYTELYAKAPQDIPLEKIRGAKVLRSKTAKSYRT